MVIENGGRGRGQRAGCGSLWIFPRTAGRRRDIFRRERRLAVIVISATVFLAIVLYSARKLLGAMRSV